ncbi:MAG TPA: hypothetical protein VHZ76_09130, partial [Gammaproteobacteria bacterium]|nr:hypothetical protein [Gammaproteobacteria bacterium]
MLSQFAMPAKAPLLQHIKDKKSEATIRAALNDYIAESGDINAVCNDNDETILSFACRENYLEIIKILLDQQADLLKVDKGSHSCLMRVMSAEACQLIITAAAQKNCLQQLFNLRNADAAGPMSAMDMACMNGKPDVLNLLLEYAVFDDIKRMVDSN